MPVETFDVQTAKVGSVSCARSCVRMRKTEVIEHMHAAVTGRRGNIWVSGESANVFLGKTMFTYFGKQVNTRKTT